ncbi:MAG: hypothetical protein IJ763_09215 [Lachnospiraceae bacterium]|nr:hypothetical protein [Lachnospiraceae bacterium]
MTGKLKTWEKIVEIIYLLLIVMAGIYKGLSGRVDGGILGFHIFIGIIVFASFLVAAFLPATYRMTKEQKAKIKDEAKCQERYTMALVIVNLFLCTGYSALMLLL